ncbi:MAG: hypothetical protein ACOCXM_11865 [Myxococcota bacterium]
MRISNSFSEGEVQILEFILSTLLRGGTPTMATRHKDFASLYRKVLTMKKRMHGKDEPAREAPEKSSVGTVAAPDAEPHENVG